MKYLKFIIPFHCRLKMKLWFGMALCETLYGGSSELYKIKTMLRIKIFSNGYLSENKLQRIKSNISFYDRCILVSL